MMALVLPSPSMVTLALPSQLVSSASRVRPSPEYHDPACVARRRQQFIILEEGRSESSSALLLLLLAAQERRGQPNRGI